MYKMYLPLSDLVARLQQLNIDRYQHYCLLARIATEPPIKTTLLQLAGNSYQNLQELEAIASGGSEWEAPADEFKVPRSLWMLLEQAMEEEAIIFIVGILYRIETQFILLYQFVQQLGKSLYEAQVGIIETQCLRLLSVKATLPHLFWCPN